MERAQDAYGLVRILQIARKIYEAQPRVNYDVLEAGNKLKVVRHMLANALYTTMERNIVVAHIFAL